LPLFEEIIELINNRGPAAIIYEVIKVSLCCFNQLIQHLPCVSLHHLHVLLLNLVKVDPYMQELAPLRQQYLPKCHCSVNVKIFEASILSVVKTPFVEFLELGRVSQLSIQAR
jgi:hypothetical protein